MQEIVVSIPVDDDGFIRRECPHCLQEFKWQRTFHEAEDNLSSLHCPYCGQEIERHGTWTQTQVEYMQGVAYQQVLRPMLDDFKRDVETSNRPGNLISVSVTRTDPSMPEQPAEPNDMTRMDIPCHPDAPIKVLEGWELPIHCLVCGQVYSLK